MIGKLREWQGDRIAAVLLKARDDAPFFIDLKAEIVSDGTSNLCRFYNLEWQAPSEEHKFASVASVIDGKPFIHIEPQENGFSGFHIDDKAFKWVRAAEQYKRAMEKRGDWAMLEAIRAGRLFAELVRRPDAKAEIREQKRVHSLKGDAQPHKRAAERMHDLSSLLDTLDAIVGEMKLAVIFDADGADW